MTESITIAGREFTVTHDQPMKEDFETPYLLTPKVKRGAQANFRLLRNKPKPTMLFPIGHITRCYSEPDATDTAAVTAACTAGQPPHTLVGLHPMVKNPPESYCACSEN